MDPLYVRRRPQPSIYDTVLPIVIILLTVLIDALVFAHTMV